MVMAIDDEACMSLVRLFDEPAGRGWLARQGVSEALVGALDLLVVLTVFTDSMELYQSRLRELRSAQLDYGEAQVAAAQHRYLLGCTTDHVQELGHWERRRIHDLKYFTWVEQQQRSADELTAQWHSPDYWTSIHAQAAEIDTLIGEFNRRTGLDR
jgi:hypothetical protein